MSDDHGEADGSHHDPHREEFHHDPIAHAEVRAGMTVGEFADATITLPLVVAAARKRIEDDSA